MPLHGSPEPAAASATASAVSNGEGLAPEEVRSAISDLLHGGRQPGGVKPVEQIALLQGIEIHDELRTIVDERTLALVDRRRRTAVVRRRGWLVRRVLLLADLAGLVAAMLLAEWVVTRARGTFGARGEILAFLAALPAWVVVAKLYGLYDRDEERADHSTADEVAGVFHMVTVCTWLFWVVARYSGFAHPTTTKLAVFWAAAICLISVGRAAGRGLARAQSAYLQNAVIVGADPVGREFASKFVNHPEYGINVVGFVDNEREEGNERPLPAAMLGRPGRLPAIVRLFDVERVVIAFPEQPVEATLWLIRSLKALDVQVDIVPRLYEAAAAPNAGVHLVEGLPLVGLPALRLSWSSAALKRAMDLVISAVALVVLSPLLFLVALAIRLDSRGPVLYRHARVGRGRRPIEVLKFRTMRLEACRGDRYGGESAESTFRDLLNDPERAREFSETYKLSDDPRVTRVGRFLRRTSLDELPQLMNVLRGDISLVGPRAITADELERYGDRVDDLLGVRPGVTGYWQINGRSRLSYADRVRLDLAYVAGWSFRLDLEILAKTLRTLVPGRGAV
jgi:exopolysaccharide biosynthesis polyprenyl glycosylphosphotransferase